MDEKKVREARDILNRAIDEEVIRAVKGLLKEALAPPQRFYVGQQCLCRDAEDMDWVSDVLLDMNTDEPESSFECKNHDWKYCKPRPDAVSLPNWIEHDGSKEYLNHTREDNSIVLYVTESGCSAKKDNASVRLDLEGVARYCIIPLPEWINP